MIGINLKYVLIKIMELEPGLAEVDKAHNDISTNTIVK